MEIRKIIDKLKETGTAERDELKALITEINDEDKEYLFAKARETAQEHFENKIYVRGLIEITNICKNDCLYCGIRCGNSNSERYRLDEKDILECCEAGYAMGYRTFVMQGGEDPWYTDEKMVSIISAIREKYPDCAITLSIGEKSRESYQKFYDAGANRYLLRHETCVPELYAKLHPDNMSLENRLRCLRDLKEIGYQTGCGFMVEPPYQVLDNIIDDLYFVHDFEPEMIGIGPFIPHHDTPFRDMAKGSADLTVLLLAILRLMNPKALIPATTALSTLDDSGRERGVLAGANIIMPNLSPEDVRKKYMLYDGKVSMGSEAYDAKAELDMRMKAIGYRVVTDRGDYPGM